MVRPTFSRIPHLLTKNIPALFAAGMFFFSACAFSNPLALATDLFEKSEWNLCRRECRRALMAGTEPIEKFQLMDALAYMKGGGGIDPAIRMLEPIIATNTDHQVTAIAAYHLGRLQWQVDQPEEALISFSTAFHTTTNKTLFLQSACSIFLLLDDEPDLKEGRADLLHQINTSRSEWYGTLFGICAKPDPHSDEPKAPNWIVRFYRAQISPAIGNRCTLDPSCSEYYHQAHEKHGLKAIPMVADRFFREPEVNQQKKDPVVTKNGQIRYRDPVEDHDFWMKKNK
jgi:putative component of membrane protein insertase Oxa1/YidC/SpoIIIJ protein YidD